MTQAAFTFDTKFSPKPGALAADKARFIGRCSAPKCATTKARDVGRVTRSYGTVADVASLTDECPTHHLPLTWQRVEGTFSEKSKCDPRCTSALGPICQCSCAGSNHGASWL